jgi:hypothetical protein
MDRSRARTRRDLLAALAAGATGVLAGCSERSPLAADDGRAAASSEGATRTPIPDRGALATDGTPIPPEERDQLGDWGFPSTICGAEIKEDIGIRAIVEPTYGDDWSDVDVEEKYRMGFEVGDGLTDDSYVIGVASEDGTAARAYPMSVVWWHEIVNDTLDRPLLVTFCPICQSGMVAERRVNGQETVFGVSGQLWQAPQIYAESAKTDGRVFGASATDGEAEARNSGNLVLFDALTGSYWSQFLARAICGAREGERLRIVPSTVTTWGRWQAEHPETDALLPPPHSAVM